MGLNLHISTKNPIQSVFTTEHWEETDNGQMKTTYPCEVNGVNVAATSPVSLLSPPEAMTDTILI